MHRRSFSAGVFRTAVAAAVLMGLGSTPSAFAWPPEKLTCPGKQVVQRIETKECPVTPKRPMHIRKRVCCQNPAGKVHCRPFQPCPPNSPN